MHLSMANDEGMGIAKNWGIDLQIPNSEVATDVYNMHFFVLIIMALITIFVLALLLWVGYRYSEKKNKTPSKESTQYFHRNIMDSYSLC